MAKDNIVLRWNAVLLQAIKNMKMKPPVVARAVAMVNTAMYDAWAHYDSKALPVYVRNFTRTPTQYRNDDNRQKAMSYAAFGVLCDLYPKEQWIIFEALMQEYKYDISKSSRKNDTPEGIGNVCADDLKTFRHDDNANQLNDYADTSGSYKPVNTADELCDINHWQPLKIKQPDGSFVTQSFLYPHWGLVKTFAVNPQEVKPPIPPRYPRPLPVANKDVLTPEEQKQAEAFEKNCRNALDFSKNLDDRTKVIAEYWEGGGGSVTPPGIWVELARQVSLRDCNDLNKDIKLFFALGNALMDASIACWFAKVRYDFCRPITAIRALLKGVEVEVWAGKYRGKKIMMAEQWETYLSPTPPFAEYVSGHSTFSGASAEVLKLFTGNDYFDGHAKISGGQSKYEGGVVPANDIKLDWKKFSEAAEQAGISRLYGGIHFWAGNTEGLSLGKKVGTQVWAKVKKYCDGTIKDEENC
jgi:hypothetical protein